jgi:hypothetical protein
MAVHTNTRAALARSDRLTPEDLLLDQETRTIWCAVTADRDVMRKVTTGPIRWVIYRLRRESNRSCPLELLARIIVWLANAGVSEATLRMIPLFISRVIEECFAGSAHRTLNELDREKCGIEATEHALELDRRIEGADTLSPDALEAEALADEREASVDIERARLLRRVARLRRTRPLQFPDRSASLTPS